MYIVRNKTNGKYKKNGTWTHNINEARVYPRTCDAVQSVGVYKEVLKYKLSLPDNFELVEVNVSIKETETDGFDYTYVDSSVVDAVAWKEDKLRVVFNTGSKYEYSPVPRVVATGMIGTNSVGKFFNRYITGIYKYEKVG